MQENTVVQETTSANQKDRDCGDKAHEGTF